MSALERNTLFTEWESLPEFEAKMFPPRSFLHWDERDRRSRESCLQDDSSTLDALVRLATQFPNLRIVRGAGLAKPMGVNGDFFVGNVRAALGYTIVDATHTERELPIIVTASLKDIVHFIHEGKVILIYDDIRRFIAMGVINIDFKEVGWKQYMQIMRPSREIELDRLSFGSFQPSFWKRTRKLFRV